LPVIVTVFPPRVDPLDGETLVINGGGGASTLTIAFALTEAPPPFGPGQLQFILKACELLRFRVLLPEVPVQFEGIIKAALLAKASTVQLVVFVDVHVTVVWPPRGMLCGEAVMLTVGVGATCAYETESPNMMRGNVANTTNAILLSRYIQSSTKYSDINSM